MLKPVYALIGDDSFLQMQKLNEIRAQLPKDVQSIEFDGERAELVEVLDELRSFAMFGGGGKLVVIRNADEFITRFRDPLEDYVAKPSTSGTLVFRCKSMPSNTKLYKLISKTGQVESCEPPKLSQIPAWVVNRGKSVHKLAIDPPAAKLLGELIGNDLGRLDNELAKLALQVETGGRVTNDSILNSVSFQREQEIKDMTVELATGQIPEALRRWRLMVQLDTSAQFRAVTWLTMWLEDVGVVLSGQSAGKLSWKYGDRFPQFMKVVKTMNHRRYLAAVTDLAELDRRSKSGLGDAVSNVEQFIISFAP